MYQEFEARLRETPAPDRINREEEWLDASTQVFVDILLSLRDPDLIPSKELNRLASLGCELVSSNAVFVAISSEEKIDQLCLGRINSDGSQPVAHAFFVPPNYVEMVKDNPALEISRVAYQLSVARDAVMGKIVIEDGEWHLRANGFKAETLLAIKGLVHANGGILELPEDEQELLRNFPDGLLSVPEQFRYSTPSYNPMVVSTN